MSDETCHIYLIAHVVDGRLDGLVKVGITANLSGRLATIQTGNPRKVDIAFSFGTPSRAIAQTLELAFHEVFAKHRMAGEWFDMNPVLALQGLVENLTAAFNYFIEDEELKTHALSASGVDEAISLLEGIRALAAKNGGSDD